MGILEYLDAKKAVSYLNKIEKETRSQFEIIKKEHYNPGTKGYDFEETLKDFYSRYLSEAYNFFVRRPILDINLKVETVFKRTNEFDIVATYKNSVPRLIYKIRNTEFIPYDSVAFITEVKQTLTKRDLKKDLKKLQKLNELETGNPFKYLPFPYLRSRPERILFYYERKARESSIIELLGAYENSWDIVTILGDDVIFTNTTNYAAKNIMKRKKWGCERKFPLVKTIIHATYPTPYSVNSWDLILNLIRSSLKMK